MDEKLNPKRRPFLMPNRHVSKNMRIREVSAACPAYYGRGLGVKGRRLNVKSKCTIILDFLSHPLEVAILEIRSETG